VCAWDDPDTHDPQGPVFTTPTYMQYPSVPLTDRLLYNANMVYQIYKYPDVFPITVPLDFAQDDIVINSVVELDDDEVYRNTIDSRNQEVLGVPYHHNAIYCDFPLDADYQSAEIILSPFWFVPYSDLENINGKQSRRICLVRAAQALKDSYPYLEFEVHVKYSLMGNNNVYSDTIEYTLSAISQGAGFNVAYEDIVDYDDVPVYFHEFRIVIPNFIADSHMIKRNNWIGVYIPVATEDEVKGNELNNYYLYNNTIHYSTEFNLDLEWIIDGVQGFLNAELFMGITFGGIFMLAITCTLAIFVLKMLNHLK
jgi:hypothetical protein